MKPPCGICCICGTFGKLSFEHIPPYSAFNDRPLVLATLERLLEAERKFGDLDRVTGRKSQRGMGGYTLCGKCNSDTGAWYGNSYRDWVVQGVSLLDHSISAPSLIYTYRIFPLLVLKQIVCMFLSSNGDKFHKYHQDLVKFVLDPREQFINPSMRIYAYYVAGGRAGKTGIVVKGDLASGKNEVLSELSFPPFGYVMTLDGCQPDDRLVDITFFSQFQSSDWSEIHLNFPVLPIYTWFPADYRSRSEVLSDIVRARQSYGAGTDFGYQG